MSAEVTTNTITLVSNDQVPIKVGKLPTPPPLTAPHNEDILTPSRRPPSCYEVSPDQEHDR
jgi:hypothetical protein